MNRSEQRVADDILRQEPDVAVIRLTATGNPDFIVISKAVAPSLRFCGCAAPGARPHRPFAKRIPKQLEPDANSLKRHRLSTKGGVEQSTTNKHTPTQKHKC